MAVAFDAVGPSAAGASSIGSTALSWTHTIGGGVTSGVVLAGVAMTDSASDAGITTTVTCGGTAMTSLGKVHCNGNTLGYLEVFGLATGSSTGAKTIAVTAAGATPDGMEGGSLSFSGASQGVPFGTAALGSGATTPATKATAGSTSGNIVAGFTAAGSGITSATAPSTSRFINNGNSGTAAAGSCAGATSPSTGSAVTMAWTIGADWWAEVVVEVLAAGAAAPSPPPALLFAPGWFPGSAAVTEDPGGIPFWAQPRPTDAAPAVIIPPSPEAAPATLFAPGWFPGSAAVTQDPGGIPFYSEPPKQTPAPAVIFPVPEVAGEAQWLPLPPGYFPGSQTVTVDPGGIPFYSQPLPLTPPPAPPPVPVITGTAGTGAGYFRDQNGLPKFLLGDEAWGLLANAGAWNSGNWTATIGNYLAARAAQGFTSMIVSVLSFGGDGACVFTNGNDWDNTPPFVSGGDPSTGLNEPFWARRDYLLKAAAGLGITVIMNPCFNLAFQGAGTALNGKTSTQFGDYGTALGNRYKGYQNLMWIVGDDYFGTIDTELTAFRTGLRGAGDTHALTIQNYQETTSRKDLFDASATPWGVSFAEFSWVYSYNVSYDGVEKAHLESSPLPLARGDGQFIVPGDHADILLQRSLTWWALSSGARGYNAGSENVWRWEAGAAAAVTSDGYFSDGTARNIRAAFESLTGWHLLIPDTSSLLVTAGRGTHRSPIASGGSGTAYTGTSDAYVTASKTPDGSLAVVYMSHGSTITIDQSKLGAGYTATWIDPASGATSSATTGTTYNSTAKGSNSAGDPDWVLAFQGPPVGGPSTATLAGAGAVTAKAAVIVTATAAGAGGVAAAATQIAPVTAAGAGSVAAVVTQAVIASPAGAGALTGAVTQAVTAAPAGAGAVSAVVTQAVIASPAGAGSVTADASVLASGSTAALAGAGAVAAVVTQIAPASPAGAGTLTALVTQTATASLAGAAAVTANVTQAVTASPAGSGTVAAVVTEAVTATAAGAGSVAAVVTQAVIASPAGAGALTANPAGAGITANLAGAGAVTALATVAAAATAAGAGAVAATVTQRGSAALSGAGAVSPSGQITGTASLAAAGTVSAKAVQAATAQTVGAAALTALATQRAIAALAGAGALTATGTSTASILNATSAPVVTVRDTSLATVTGRPGAPAVTSKAGSSPAVSDG